MPAASPVEDMIREIAVEHGIAVGRDDPIMVLCTVNQRLLEDSAAAHQKVLQRFESEVERIATTWSDDASAKAQKLLATAATQARDLLVETSKRSADLAADAIASRVRADITSASTEIAAAVKAIRWLAIVTGISAVLVLGTMAFLVLTFSR